MGRGEGWSSDFGISKAGEGMEELFSMRGKGDSLLLETLAAVLPSREWPGRGLGLLQRGRLGLITPLGHPPNETPNNEPPDFSCREEKTNWLSAEETTFTDQIPSERWTTAEEAETELLSRSQTLAKT